MADVKTYSKITSGEITAGKLYCEENLDSVTLLVPLWYKHCSALREWLKQAKQSKYLQNP